MAEMGEHFKIDYSVCKSKPQSIFQGQFYRITVLSELHDIK